MSSKKSEKERKDKICKELSAVIKEIQEAHVFSKEIESNDQSARYFCDVLEAVFLHGLKNPKSLWPCLALLIPENIKLVLSALRNSQSDIWKCRAWLRLALVKRQLLEFFETLQKHTTTLQTHYSSEAFLRDPELCEVVLQLLKGVAGFQFQYDYTSALLNTWQPSSLELAGMSRENTLPVSSERISPPQSEVLYTEQLTLEGNINSAVNISPQPRRATIHSYSSSNHPESSTPETNRTNSVESDASFNAMLRRYSAAVTRPQFDNRTRYSYAYGDRKIQSISNVDPSKTSDLAAVVAMDYEVLSDDATVNAQHAEHKKQHFQTMTAILTKIATQKGLDSQAFRCAACKAPVGIIFGMARTCYYTGQYYCNECHLQELRVIPARVLFNWDFKCYHVCVGSCEYLDSIEYMPVLDIDEVNSTLYNYIPELEKCRDYRTQLYHLKGYLLTCSYAEDTKKVLRKLTDAHLFEKIHVYSLRNLMDLHSGLLLPQLTKALRKAIKHVKKCPLCCQKGFVCEICQSPSVIYPFQLDETFQECIKSYGEGSNRNMQLHKLLTLWTTFKHGILC
ncbi:uncharacterized protein [Dysidea avara]|uniref:uncharacterized protein isoform X2 n=1 Tax=Dysidea avara TaxID=196820 RepID=UPI00331B013F